MKKRFLFLCLAACLLLSGCGGSTQESANPNEGLYPATNFVMTDESGATLSLQSLVGKPIVLNFWASWCPPCKAELPDFENAYKQYGDKICFVMLSMDDTVEAALSLVNDAGYTFPVYHDTYGQASSYYNVSAIPQTYFINKDGYVVTSYSQMITAEQLQGGIDLLLK